MNAELVRAGYTWVYQKYATDRSLSGLEAEAPRRRDRGAKARRVPAAQRGRGEGGLKEAVRLRRWRSYPRFTATNEPPKKRSPS